MGAGGELTEYFARLSLDASGASRVPKLKGSESADRTTFARLSHGPLQTLRATVDRWKSGLARPSSALSLPSHRL